MFTDNYKKYRKSFSGIRNLATKYKTTPQVIEESVIKEKSPQIVKYLQSNGIKPGPTPQDIAIQFTLLHQRKIAERMKNKPGTSYVSAEKQVFADEERAEYYGGESESFAPALIGAILSAGTKGIEAVNQKRTAKGKKPLLSGKFWNFLKTNVEAGPGGPQGEDLRLLVKGSGKPMADTELNAGLNALNDELLQQGKQSWIRKNQTILIIGGLAVLVAVWYFFIRKK